VHNSIARGTCIEGYAQAMVGAAEAAMKIKYNWLPTASMQELIDCSSSNGNAGCGGGFASYASNYVYSTCF
jgi:cathepsin L